MNLDRYIQILKEHMLTIFKCKGVKSSCKMEPLAMLQKESKSG